MTVETETRESTQAVLAEIAAERQYQDATWGGAERDDKNSPYSWIVFINSYLGGAAQAAMTMRELEYINRSQGFAVNVATYRAKLLKVAALAVAAIESVDRYVDVAHAEPH